METKHTPGKWHLVKCRSLAHLHNDVGALVASLRYQSDLEQANAALIAQAPDLLTERDRLAAINADLVAALEDASFLLAKIGKFPGDLPQFMNSIIRSVQDSRAALAKAKVE